MADFTIVLQKQDIEAWFDYPSGGRVLLRHVPPEVDEQIQDEVQTLDIRRNRFQGVKTDHDKRTRLIVRNAVKGWEDFTAGGETLPFSEDAAVLLMKRSREFKEFVDERRGDLDGFVKQLEAETEGNSGDTSG